MALRVLVSDKIYEGGVERLKQDPEVEVDVITGLLPDQLLQRIGEYDGLIVRSETKVTAEIFAAAKRLKVVGRAGVGVDNIDVEAASRHGVVVVNAPEGNTIAAAEHTLAMLLALSRYIPQAHASLAKERRWERGQYLGVQLQGKTLGVVGLGRIGSEVAARSLAFEMKVLAYDPFITHERARKLGVELADVDEICRRSDFITVHTPLTRATEHLINDRQFGLMKDGVRIINCARGGIIDEEALATAIRCGRVVGAALDVFEQEPPLNSPLLDLPQVIATPHLGASTFEAQVNVAIDVAEEVLRAMRGEPVRNAVNVPSIRPEVFESLRPYLDLAERIGKVYGGLIAEMQPKIEIVYSGEVSQLETAPLTSAVLKGMLGWGLRQTVTIVNAPLLAKERGLHVVEVKETEAEGFATLITVRGKGDETGRRAAGSLTSGGHPRLVMIDGYRLNVMPSGRLLVSHHTDRPGMIGGVGTLLGEAGINIAFMQVGRESPMGDAVMVLGVDNDVPEEILDRLRAIPDLSDVRLVEW